MNSRRKLIPVVAGLAVFALALFALHRELAGYSFRQVRESLDGQKPIALLMETMKAFAAFAVSVVG